MKERRRVKLERLNQETKLSLDEQAKFHEEMEHELRNNPIYKQAK
jgi:hypothetical protein